MRRLHLNGDTLDDLDGSERPNLRLRVLADLGIFLVDQGTE